jgi:hypothetical protein
MDSSIFKKEVIKSLAFVIWQEKSKLGFDSTEEENYKEAETLLIKWEFYKRLKEGTLDSFNDYDEEGEE